MFVMLAVVAGFYLCKRKETKDLQSSEETLTPALESRLTTLQETLDRASENYSGFRRLYESISTSQKFSLQNGACVGATFEDVDKEDYKGSKGGMKMEDAPKVDKIERCIEEIQKESKNQSQQITRLTSDFARSRASIRILELDVNNIKRTLGISDSKERKESASNINTATTSTHNPSASLSMSRYLVDPYSTGGEATTSLHQEQKGKQKKTALRPNQPTTSTSGHVDPSIHTAQASKNPTGMVLKF